MTIPQAKEQIQRLLRHSEFWLLFTSIPNPIPDSLVLALSNLLFSEVFMGRDMAFCSKACRQQTVGL